MAELKATGKFEARSVVFGLLAVVFALWWFSGDASIFDVVFGVAIAGFGLWQIRRGLGSVLARARISEPVVATPVRALPLGGHFVVTYQQKWSRTVDVQRVVMRLVLRETVRYGSGNTTQTDKHDKVVQRLETQGRRFARGEVLSGEYSFQIPSDGMHTFVPSPDNRIEWYVTLDVELTRWPNMHQEYEITVLPRVGG
jgi:hypothetical protein